MIVDLTSVNNANYEIVGGITEPTSPSANTIWVETEHDITGHVFGSTQPDNPYEGMLFIKTGFNNRADSFSVYKTHPVMVYPVQVKQYVNDEWISVLARRYHDDGYTKWWDGDLFNTAITGGLEKLAENNPTINNTVKFSGRTISITSSGSSVANGIIQTVKKFDITDWDTVRIRLSYSGTFSITFRLSLRYLDGTTWTTAATEHRVLSPDIADNEFTLSLKIPDFSGPYYVSLRVSTANVTAGSARVNILELTLL